MRDRNQEQVPDSRQSYFDRRLGALFGIPDVLSTSPATIQTARALVGDAQTFIVQTYRMRDDDGAGKVKSGDTVFLQYVDAEGSVRIVLPPEVTACIARQRDALTTRSRKRGAKAAAEDRKARGIQPGFLKKKK
jgi:hypothetical protein